MGQSQHDTQGLDEGPSVWAANSLPLLLSTPTPAFPYLLPHFLPSYFQQNSGSS